MIDSSFGIAGSGLFSGYSSGYGRHHDANSTAAVCAGLTNAPMPSIVNEYTRRRRPLGNTLTISSAEVDLKLLRASAQLDADPAAAARAAGEILASSPGHAAASLLLATASRSIGDATMALDVLAELAHQQPASGVIQLELARASRAAGRRAATLAALRRAVELAPDLADGWRELSGELALAGDERGSDLAYARYSALAREAWQLVEPAAALAENRLAAAEELLQRHLEHSPKDPAAIRMLAQAALRREDYARGERLLGECLQLAPGYAAARFDLANALYTQQKTALVLPLIERLLALDPQNLAYRNLQASALSFTGQHDRSLHMLAELLAERPDQAQGWMNYGHELKAAGRLQEGIAAYRKSIALDPGGGAAYWSLANLKTFRFETVDIEAMRAALAREDLRAEDRVEFEFALGKALEDERRFAESFEHYASGNSLRRSAVIYDADKTTAHVVHSKELYTQQFFAQRSGWGSEAVDPIFIVGLPRAGSTLLEQILASHSRVEGTRELPDIAAIARGLGGAAGEADNLSYLDSISSLRADDVRALAGRYLEHTRVYRLSGAPRFIDKMPNNFLHIGLIHLLFPRAAIVDARRHPMGCCFSCFKQYFPKGQPFTYDLGELGRYYRDYVELMEHFDTVLPGRVRHVFYEQVVGAVERETRALLGYCGLPFEEACLRFYENPRVVQTASSEQVRRPIFAEGVGQWRHYEPWLGTLQEALGDSVARYPAH
jgi:predicted Zn-dependent protease